MLKDSVKKYAEQNYNCSESLLRGMNEYYQLNLDENALRLAAGLGGGLYSGDICGCLTGAVMGLSAMYVDDRSNTAEGFKEEVQDFYQAFLAEYGYTDCTNLREVQRHPELGCKEFMVRVAAFVENYQKK